MVNTKAQFDKAVAIIKALPEDGPVKPSQDEQLAVSNVLRPEPMCGITACSTVTRSVSSR